MTVTIASNALTTLATVAEEIGYTVGGTSDDYLKRLINSYSQAIENYCNRKFGRTAVTDEKVAGKGTRRLLVDYYPVDTTETTTVTHDDGAVSSDAYEWEDGGEWGSLFNLYGVWNWDTLAQYGISQGPAAGYERALYKVSYTGGYYLPASASRDLPYDIEDVCIQMVATAYRNKGKNRYIASEKILSASVSYRDASKWPSDWTMILDSYKRFF